MPSAFPIDHLRFWSNRVIPCAGFFLSLIAIWAGHTVRLRLRLGLLVAIAAGWCAFAVAAAQIFPVTFRALWIPAFLIGVSIGVTALFESHVTATRVQPWVLGIAVLGGSCLESFSPSANARFCQIRSRRAKN
jgi:hypothetical protein